MSSPAVHFAQGIGSTAVLYPVLGENAIIFGAATILIDVDHIFDYVADTKDFHPKGFFTYYDILLRNIDKNIIQLHLFHTIECYLLLFWLAQTFPVFYYVLGGFLFHHLFDLISFLKAGKPFLRAFSIPEYLIRRKRYLTSIREVFEHQDVNVQGIANLAYWLEQWDIPPETTQYHKLAYSKSK